MREMANPFGVARERGGNQKIRDEDATGENLRRAEAEVGRPNDVEGLRMQRVDENLAGFVEIEGIVYGEGRVEERKEQQSRESHGGQRRQKCVGSGLRMRL